MNIFRYDSKLMQMLEILAYWMILSPIWILLQLPVFTAGPASAGLYYTTVKSMRMKRENVLKSFFKGLKMNFKQGALMSLLFVGYLFVLGMSFYYTRYFPAGWLKALYPYILLALAIPLVLVLPYVYPVMSRFDAPLGEVIKYALFLSIRHFLTTISLWVLIIACVIGCMYMPPAVFLLPGIGFFTASYSIEAVLKKHIPEDKRESERDHWSFDPDPDHAR